MSSPNESFSDADSIDEFIDDFEALSGDFEFTDKNPIASSSSSEVESDREDDLQLLRSLQERLSMRRDLEEKPRCRLKFDYSDEDDCEDDYETLRAIQRRFAAYSDGGLKTSGQDTLSSPVQMHASEPAVEKSKTHDGGIGRESSPKVEQSQAGANELALLPQTSSQSPKSAMLFVDAIKKNKYCQKLLRRKMVQMDARIEELKKLREGVIILRNFQINCKRMTGRALSLKKDPCVPLISASKSRANKKRKMSAICKGPPENFQVANYREALALFVGSAHSEKWSLQERENLVKGVKQQFQGMLLQRYVDIVGESDGQYDSSIFDSMASSIKNHDVTPEQMRAFLPKINWEELVAMYVPNRSGAECQARFLNSEDPLINHNPWTATEDKNLLYIIQQQGLSNWLEIAASLGTNRTPFQCLSRYQRSLNPSILKREWTKDEDNQLRAAVETFGESDWQSVASVIEGRTGTQCSNRWLKTLHPTRKTVGRWSKEEDKRLKVAVTLFGPKTWKEVAKYVSGRTHVQCRERWVNCLDPSLNMAPWTEEEDAKLKAAIAEHGHCWSKVAACVPKRTDNHCWRRWKVLFPDEVPLLRATRMVQKVAFISNFVDRTSERPALGPNDFVLPETFLSNASQNTAPPRRRRRRSGREAQEHIETNACPIEMCLDGVPRSTNGEEVVGHVQSDGLTNTRVSKLQPRRKRQDKTLEAVSNTLSVVDTQIGEATIFKTCRKRKQTGVTDDQSSNIKKEY